MPLSPSAQLFLDKVQDAVSYASKEAEVTVTEALGVLEIVKLNLYHKYSHVCAHCGNTQTCVHCNSIHPEG